MLVANSFDLWQRDTFFSAAEEVQRSADIMESAFRTWEREKRYGLKPELLGELFRELQTALGTAKWQLEEFEKAVSLSYRSHADDVTITRHGQFINAIGNQISRVETSLQQSLDEQGRNPLRWVSLDREEYDDLASFLSGTTQNMIDTCVYSGASTNISPKKDSYIETERDDSITNISPKKDKYIETEQDDSIKAASEGETSYHVKATEFVETTYNFDCEANITSGSRTTWSSSNTGDWKIVIDNEEDSNKSVALVIDGTPKENGSKPVFWSQSPIARLEANGGYMSSYFQLRRLRWINQILGHGGGCQRQSRTSIQLKFNTLKFKLALILVVFLIVPFLLYSA